MTKNLTLDQVRVILEKGDFNELVGAVENEWLECKAAPYQLDKDHQRQELAKDVAGLANAGGGIILIGIKTERDLTHFGDEIKEVRSFAPSLINPEQYIDILKSWIYPPLDKIDVKWLPSSTDSNAGIVSIFIPLQPEAKIPFLLTRTLDTEGRRVEIVFGFVERRRAGVDSLSVQGLHTLIRDGLHAENLSGRLESIEEALARIELQQSETKSRVETVNFPKLLQERLDEALIDADLSGKRSFTLGAIPMEPVEILTIFEARNAEVVRLLEHPPELRSGGFDLDTGSPATLSVDNFGGL
jgi:Putative DNA-binding domain